MLHRGRLEYLCGASLHEILAKQAGHLIFQVLSIQRALSADELGIPASLSHCIIQYLHRRKPYTSCTSLVFQALQDEGSSFNSSDFTPYGNPAGVDSPAKIWKMMRSRRIRWRSDLC